MQLFSASNKLINYTGKYVHTKFIINLHGNKTIKGSNETVEIVWVYNHKPLLVSLNILIPMYPKWISLQNFKRSFCRNENCNVHRDNNL